MIRLTLNANSNPEVHLFNKSTLILGSDSADLILPGPGIQSIHLKIIEQNGFHILINQANDPFVSVNGYPFGKKLLNSGDVLVVHETTILYETLLTPTEGNQQQPSKNEEITSNDQEKKPSLASSQFSSFSLPFEEDIEVLREEEFPKTSLEVYLKELETSQKAAASTLKKTQAENKKNKSLKDDYLRDLEDENHREKGGPFSLLKEKRHLYQSGKWILTALSCLLLLTAIVGGIIYFKVSDKSEAQETKAAQGVADVAMALIQAHLNHLKPHNQNWADVEFLKSNLQAVLPDSPSYASKIDAQGQFICCPYSLRIYTNADLSHFLLIAQPAPNLLYWLLPQSIIVVDSHLMELRTLKDVRNLNRLLANPDPLDGVNGKEITHLVKGGGLISLSTLAKDSGHVEFAPPKNLGWIWPGAENLIYNAPRYYRLGQAIVQQAINLATNKGSSQDVAALKKAVDGYALLNHVILYSDQGKKSADLLRQGLMMYAPTEKLLFGYLLFNAHGKIHQVHLLKEEEEEPNSDIAKVAKKDKEEQIAVELPSEIENQEAQNSTLAENPTVDLNHPIYIQLHALITARENELKPLVTALFNLVNQELQKPRAQFQIEFQNLSHSYLMANEKHKKALKESLDSLFVQYQNIPIQDFLAFIKILRIEHLIQQDNQSLCAVEENCHQNMEILLNHIENSKSLAELEHIIHIATSWLNFDYIKDPHDLMKYQNLLRNQLIEELEKYLLSQKKQLGVKAGDREALIDILNQERLIKPEEKDFFLEEFDQLIASQDSEENHEGALKD